MPSENSPLVFPRDNTGLALMHEDVAMSFEYRGMTRVGEALALMFGESAAQDAFRAILFRPGSHAFQETEREEFETLGWRAFLADAHMDDAIAMTQLWRDGAEYAGQGLVPHERIFVSLQEREARIKELIAKARTALECSQILVGNEFDFIWHGVAARAAIDFDGKVSLEGLHLLSNLPMAVVRNAVSIRELHPDETGTVTSEEANKWLSRRREFCPSRWRNPHDDQSLPEWEEDKDRAEANEKGMIWIPQAADDDRFTPDRVVRAARGTAGISITVGAKGEEKQFHDFYEALRALAEMGVARWRRRNSVGNWGIVRARGAWVAVRKADIDQLLTDKLAEL